ncbi:aldose epimerase family protein [Pararobbsia silviterrae]|uniref:Aldose 1-epimerase n=1 Tax=Pararobbsia silviterrae TaxID=1792498 RepID=A0A494XHZ8_9BURK|nr:aldose epimerase family protein [Pararobbsia silviterrae]RKP47704.1 galactose mutarotase [Pararobbsia silviterrae]
MRTNTIASEVWGTLPAGDTVRRFTLRNAQDMKISVSDFGGALLSWHAPDRSGRLDDILLGHDTPSDYWNTRAFMGALIGRWANRIAGARFTLDGIEYTLDRNEGENLLHGGSTGFDRGIWEVEPENGGLRLRYESPEGDAGFPGAVEVDVLYTLDDDGTLTIDYRGVTDAPTPLNLTNHAYFNLSGRDLDIRGHMLSIAADQFLEVDDALIPIGVAEVTGSAFDFRAPAPIGARLGWPHAQLTRAQGFDHCYVLSGEVGTLRHVANVYDPASGREMDVVTTERGMQFYSGNHLEGVRGKDGAVYHKHAGFCLETGGYPNEVNSAHPEPAIFRPGQTYRQTTQYRVGLRSDG